MHSYMDAVLRPQGYRCDRLDGAACDKLEVESLLSHGKQQRGLQHREGSSHANSRTASKRKISKPRNFSRADGVFAPALWIKLVWIGKEARIALRQRLEDKNIRP